ncbi:hypothetical protein GA0111570_102121 [Raineyella antarctica]|uniref:Uncharacterized protein n=1 Tax=Raineyella antarctica TaxID=1577474 RepID=A0A1G6GES2_9ACTN|nr:hypothetical protein [Raineyella antarctica]SDB80333.1 hypothetical protein GA0111570_102121 [Raineyella antarctica]
MSEPEGLGWHRTLAYALTGEDLSLPPRPAPDEAVLAGELDAAGWDREALRRHADATRSAGTPWPHPVPAELAEGLPAAQFSAALRALVADWGLAPAAVRVRSAGHGRIGAGRPSPADERLLRDLPPHFGKL